MDSPMDKYVKALKYDIKIADTYFRKSVEKTEQQKQLENLLSNDKVFLNATEIVDIACGGGDSELSFS